MTGGQRIFCLQCSTVFRNSDISVDDCMNIHYARQQEHKNRYNFSGGTREGPPHFHLLVNDSIRRRTK